MQQLELFPQTFDSKDRWRFVPIYKLAIKVNPIWYRFATDYLWRNGIFNVDVARLPEYKGPEGYETLKRMGCRFVECDISYTDNADRPLVQRKTEWPKPRKPFEDIEISDL